MNRPFVAPSLDRSFESWADAFSFSDEWQGLETSSATEAPGAAAPTPAGPVRAPEPSLQELVDVLSRALATRLSREDFVEKLVAAQRLKEENAALSAQVRQLLKEKKALQEEVVYHQHLLLRFKKIAGNLFLRFD